MPWRIEQNHDGCSAGKPWAVVKETDGSIAGCHETEAKAKAQLAALNIAEGETMAEELKGKWFPVFRAGEYGEKGAWTEADIDQMISDYSADLHEAPAVIGHPKDDAPAYGWITALRRSGETMEAFIVPAVQEFVQWVNQGLWKHISVAIYKMFPETGRPYVKHVGFLGAQAPEVKGLPAAAFGHALAFTEVTMGEQPRTEKRPTFMTKLKTLLQLFQEEGEEAAAPAPEETPPSPPAGVGEGLGAEALFQSAFSLFNSRVWQILDDGEVTDKKAAIMAHLDELRAMLESQEFAEGKGQSAKRNREKPKQGGEQMLEKAVVFTEDQVKEREKTAADNAKAELQQQHAAWRHKAEVTAFIEGRKKEGKYLPAWDAMGLTQLIESLPAEATIEFGDPSRGSGQGEKKSPWQVMKAFLESLPKVVTFEETAKGRVVAGDTAGAKLNTLAKQFAEEKKVSYGVAFLEVQKTNPDLAEAYADEARGR